MAIRKENGRKCLRRDGTVRGKQKTQGLETENARLGNRKRKAWRTSADKAAYTT
jgi:hypothetical protein